MKKIASDVGFGLVFLLFVGAVTFPFFTQNTVDARATTNEAESVAVEEKGSPADTEARRQLANLIADAEGIGDEILAKFPISDLRQVTVIYTWEPRDYSIWFVHKDQVQNLVDATKKLHVNPGINPHNENPTKKIVAIQVATPSFSGPFWWTTPDLKENYDYEHGATLISFDRFEWGYYSN